MRVVAIIQARMGSTRLPGKVLKHLAGRPVLYHVLDRVVRSRAFDEVVVATTTGHADDAIEDKGLQWGARVVRGSEDDVLGRYAKAAKESGADVIARITADCPLIDPNVLSEMVARFRSEEAVDLVTNARVRTFPRGLDAEIFARSALDDMNREAALPYEREHVTPFLYSNPSRYRILDFVGTPDLSALRWTLDTSEDFDLLEKLYGTDPGKLELDEVLTLLRENPEWAAINAHVVQKAI